MANDSVYGLGGAVWTRDLNRAIRVSRGVETGRMWVNTYNQIPAGAPFGGYKHSGIGRETHKVILSHYTQQKNIMINLGETPSGFYPAQYGQRQYRTGAHDHVMIFFLPTTSLDRTVWRKWALYRSQHGGSGG